MTPFVMGNEEMQGDDLDFSNNYLELYDEFDEALYEDLTNIISVGEDFLPDSLISSFNKL
jgi:hypothetical protein